MKIMKYTLILLSLVLLPIALLAGVNLAVFDEALDEPVARALAVNREWVLEGNGFAYLYGLSASSNISAEQQASEVLALMAQLSSVSRKSELGAALGEKLNQLVTNNDADAEWLAEYDALDCRFRDDPACFSALVAQVSNIGSMPLRAKKVLGRYQKMLNMKVFIEPQFMDWETSFPDFQLAMKLGFLNLATAYEKGKGEYFLAQLEKDMQYWRLVLAQSHTVLGKMVANAVLHRDLCFLSFYLLEQSPTDVQKRNIASFIKPLTADERDISEAFLEELRIAHAIGLYVHNPKAMANLLQAIAYQPNATLNNYYQYLTAPAIKLSKLSGKYLLSNIAINGDKYPGASIFPPSVFNLAGKLFFKNQLWSTVDYTARMHNLDGMYRLLNLQLIAKSEAIGPALTNEQWLNPFTETAMNYNASKNELWFECYKKAPTGCRIQRLK